MSKSVTNLTTQLVLYKNMDPKSDSEYEDVEVIVPEHTPAPFQERKTLIEKAMARMGVTTFEEFWIRVKQEQEEHSKQ